MARVKWRNFFDPLLKEAQIDSGESSEYVRKMVKMLEMALCGLSKLWRRAHELQHWG